MGSVSAWNKKRGGQFTVHLWSKRGLARGLKGGLACGINGLVVGYSFQLFEDSFSLFCRFITFRFSDLARLTVYIVPLRSPML